MQEVTRYTRRERISRWFAEAFSNAHQSPAMRNMEQSEFAILLGRSDRFIMAQNEVIQPHRRKGDA